MAGGRFKVSTIFRAVDKMSAPVAKMSGRVKKFGLTVGQNFNRIQKRAKKLGTAILGVGAAFTGFALIAGRAAFTVLKAGADFEQAITDVGAVGLKSRGEIAELEAQALELGRTTKFTATESARAMEILAKAGFKNQQILAATPAVLNAAAAAGVEMATVADVVASSLKGFGLEAEHAGDIADLLALASSRTNSTIVSLGESLRNVSATAKQLNVPIADAVTGVALLQDVGLDASVAGSSLNTMMTKLGTVTPTVEKKLKKLGISIKDDAGNMRALPDVLGQFAEGASKTEGNLERIGMFAELVGLRGAKAALVLKDMAASGRFKELNDELRNARGSAEAMAAIRMDTLTGDMTKLGSAIEGLKIDVFKNANGELRQIVQGVTAWIAANRTLLVAMASDPFGWLREAQYLAEDFFNILAKIYNTILNIIPGTRILKSIFNIPDLPTFDSAAADAQRTSAGARGLGFGTGAGPGLGGLQPEVQSPVERAAQGGGAVDELLIKGAPPGSEIKSKRKRPGSPRIRLPASGGEFVFLGGG
jgi:TP901 family phage tail tape measure protein